MSLGSIFSSLFSHAAAVEADAGALVAEAEAGFKAIAHGEGGPQKIKAVALIASQMAATAAKIADEAGAAEQQQGA